MEIQTLPKLHPQSPSQTLELDSTSQSPHSNLRVPLPHQPSPTFIAAISDNPSKIPIRPRKIRKLSIFTPSADDKPSTPSSAVSLTTSTCPVTPTTPASARNRRRSASRSSRAPPQVAKPLYADGEVELALRHLRSSDPLLIPLMDTHPLPRFDSHISPFLALTKSILYQQLAYKAGTSIYLRFVSLCGSVDSVCPDSVLALSPQQLKQIGVSCRKTSYLYDLANKYKSGILSDDVVKMDDRSLFTMLSMVKGIGSWSIHMFMIFSLQLPDVLPLSDLGVRKGVQLLYGLEELPAPSQLEQLCEKWRPYRSVGAWYMWQLVERNEASTAGSAMPLEGNIMQPLQQIKPHQQLQCVEPVNGLGNVG